jgi:exodeoxyribonuclease VII large subunit
VRRQLRRDAAVVRSLEQRLRQRHPQIVLARWRERLVALEARLKWRMQTRTAHARQSLERLTTQLSGLSPLSILARGYSITLDAQGHALRDAANATQGESLRVRLHRGGLDVKVVRRTTEVE